MMKVLIDTTTVSKLDLEFDAFGQSRRANLLQLLVGLSSLRQLVEEMSLPYTRKENYFIESYLVARLFHGV